VGQFRFQQWRPSARHRRIPRPLPSELDHAAQHHQVGQADAGASNSVRAHRRQLGHVDLDSERIHQAFAARLPSQGDVRLDAGRRSKGVFRFKKNFDPDCHAPVNCFAARPRPSPAAADWWTEIPARFCPGNVTNVLGSI
jgi:hypothetical protein